jgi:hypothetical protein
MSMVSPQLRKSAADSRDRGGAPEGGKVLVDADERDRVLQAGAAAQAGGDALRRDAAALPSRSVRLSTTAMLAPFVAGP